MCFKNLPQNKMHRQFVSIPKVNIDLSQQLMSFPRDQGSISPTFYLQLKEAYCNSRIVLLFLSYNPRVPKLSTKNIIIWVCQVAQLTHRIGWRNRRYASENMLPLKLHIHLLIKLTPEKPL